MKELESPTLRLGGECSIQLSYMDKWLISLILTVFLNFLGKNAISGIGLKSEGNEGKTGRIFRRSSGESLRASHKSNAGLF